MTSKYVYDKLTNECNDRKLVKIVDKEEFRIKLDEINHLVEAKDYKGAMEVVDSIDWRRVKNVRTLCVVGEIYAANKRYEDSRDIFLLAYHRASIGKNILYRLVEVSLKMGEIDEATDYYEEFCSVAPNDNTACVLKYKILKEKKAPIEDQIQVLEEYKSKEFTEKWSYELAKLYYMAGKKDKCEEVCSEMVLWFSDGPYVMKALELKQRMGVITDREKEKLERDAEAKAERRAREEKKASEKKPKEEEKETIIEEVEISASDDEEKDKKEVSEEESPVVQEEFVNISEEISEEAEKEEREIVSEETSEEPHEEESQEEESETVSEENPEEESEVVYEEESEILPEEEPESASEEISAEPSEEESELIPEEEVAERPKKKKRKVVHEVIPEEVTERPKKKKRKVVHEEIPEEYDEEEEYDDDSEEFPETPRKKKQGFLSELFSGKLKRKGSKIVSEEEPEEESEEEFEEESDKDISEPEEDYTEDEASEGTDEEYGETGEEQIPEEIDDEETEEEDFEDDPEENILDDGAPLIESISTENKRDLAGAETYREKISKGFRSLFGGRKTDNTEEKEKEHKKKKEDYDDYEEDDDYSDDYLIDDEASDYADDDVHDDDREKESYEDFSDYDEPEEEPIKKPEKKKRSLKKKDEGIRDEKGSEEKRNKVLNKVIDEDFEEDSDEDYDEISDEDYDETSDEVSGVDLDEVSGEVSDEEFDEDSDDDREKEPEEKKKKKKIEFKFPEFKFARVMRSAPRKEAFYIDETKDEIELESEDEDEEEFVREFRKPKKSKETKVPRIPKVSGESGAEKKAEKTAAPEVKEVPEEPKEEFNLEDTILAAAFAQGIEIPGAIPGKPTEKAEPAAVKEPAEEDEDEPVIIEEMINSEEKKSISSLKQNTRQLPPKDDNEEQEEVPDLVMPDLNTILEEEDVEENPVAKEEKEDDLAAEIAEGENEEDLDDEEYLITGVIRDEDEDEDDDLDISEEDRIESFIASLQPEYTSEEVDIIPRSKELSEEEIKLFSYFVKVPGMREQIIDALCDVQIQASDRTSNTGNIIVMGGAESGKTRLISGLIPAICKELNLKASKVAYVFAEQINGKDVNKIVSKLRGGFLVIENANQLEQETAVNLTKLMEGDTGGMIFVLEDDKIGMRKMMARYPKLAKKFTSIINIPVFTNDELANFARIYAMENGYRIDNNGMLALYNLISINQKEDLPMNIGAVKEIVDAAIAKSKGGLKLFQKNAEKKRKDENGFIILYERDFIRGK